MQILGQTGEYFAYSMSFGNSSSSLRAELVGVYSCDGGAAMQVADFGLSRQALTSKVETNSYGTGKEFQEGETQRGQMESHETLVKYNESKGAEQL